MAEKRYRLVGPDGREYASALPGTFGGHRKRRIYGRLDCKSALAHIARGRYVQHRVFFASEADARAAGFRPCGTCMKAAFEEWKAVRP
jgi:methylphosphotriester-DNA--protein-cysteine methyltransferase